MSAKQRAEDYTGKSDPLAGQREYMACRKAAVPFVAHGDAWHWYDGAERTLYSRELRFGPLGPVKVTTNVDGAEWPTVARGVFA